MPTGAYTKMDMPWKLQQKPISAAILTAGVCIALAACGNVPAGTATLGPSTPVGVVAESTFVAAQATNASGTALAYSATGAAYSAQEAQATQNAVATQKAVNVQLTLDANRRLNDAATDAARAIGTATARAEARETATAQIAASSTALGHSAATGTAQAAATSQKLNSDRKEQDLAERALWLNALSSILNNGVLVCTISLAILGIAGVVFGLAWMYLALRRRWLKDKQLEIADMGPGIYRRLESGAWKVENYPTRADVTIEATPVAEAEHNPEAHLQAWRIAVLRFVIAGDRFGFGIRDLGSEGQSVISNDGWREITRLLRDNRILREGRVHGRKGIFTIWAEGWTLQKFKAEQHSLALPYPPSEPPSVQIVPHSTTARHSTTAFRPATEVVE